LTVKAKDLNESFSIVVSKILTFFSYNFHKETERQRGRGMGRKRQRETKTKRDREDRETERQKGHKYINIERQTILNLLQ
jgi:hypothetical protein